MLWPVSGRASLLVTVLGVVFLALYDMAFTCVSGTALYQCLMLLSSRTQGWEPIWVGLDVLPEYWRVPEQAVVTWAKSLW